MNNRKQGKRKHRQEKNIPSENIRALVLESLILNDKNEKCSDIENAVLLKYAYLPKVQRAFYTRLFEGTLERRITLLYIIDTYSSTPSSKMKPVIRHILEMAVYQIKYMDSVPDSAAVNEAVRLAQLKGFGALKGFVNGILRSIIRMPDKVSWPEREEGAHYFSVMYSIPEKLASGFLSEYGPEKTEKILSSVNEPRPLTVRFRKSDDYEGIIAGLEREGVHVLKAPVGENSYILSDFDSLTALTPFKNGSISVMDSASILCVEAAGIKKGDRILDLCASPGGKAFYAADLAGSTGHVLARDISEKKAELLRENAVRYGAENIDIAVHDASEKDESLTGLFDVVLADVPCSGLGVIARKPDIRYRLTAWENKDLRELQRKILSCAAEYVKKDGVLMFSTCTVGVYENDENVEWFLREHAEFALDFKKQLLPGIDESDGFFMARLIKKR